MTSSLRLVNVGTFFFLLCETVDLGKGLYVLLLIVGLSYVQSILYVPTVPFANTPSQPTRPVELPALT